MYNGFCIVFFIMSATPTYTQLNSGSDSVSPGFPMDVQKRLRLERFAKSAKMIISQSMAYLKSELERLPSVLGVNDERERQVLVNSLFLARYGKFPQEYEEALLENVINKFVQTL